MKQESKTFFSQSAPPTILCGIIVIGCLVPCITIIFDPQFPGWSAFLCSEPFKVFAISCAIAVFLWLFLFYRIRFEKDHAALYCCLFIPVRIVYSEVTGIAYLAGNRRRPDSTSIIIFQLRSGKKRSWAIGLFADDVRKEIKKELESRIRLPERQSEIPDMQIWTYNVLRTPRSLLLIFGFAAIFTLALGIADMSGQLSWNQRIRNWDKVNGIILKNSTKRISSGKSTKKVADVEYRFTYKKRQYTGNKIVYDSDSFPDLKVGKRRQVIVNPENPNENAIMFWYRGYWGILRWVKCIFLYLASLFWSVIFFHGICKKAVIVPDALKNYIAAIAPERFFAAKNMELPAVAHRGLVMSCPMAYSPDQRFGIIRQRISVVGYLVVGVLLLLAAAVALFVPYCWILVAVIGYIGYSLYAPRVLVFDFAERKIYSGHRFDPEKRRNMKSLSFSEIDHLSLRVLIGGGERKTILLLAVKSNGSNILLCKVSDRHLDKLFDLLPVIAGKMGDLPITF